MDKDDTPKYLAIHKDAVWSLLDSTRRKAEGILSQIEAIEMKLEKATATSEWVSIESMDWMQGSMERVRSGIQSSTSGLSAIHGCLPPHPAPPPDKLY